MSVCNLSVIKKQTMRRCRCNGHNSYLKTHTFYKLSKNHDTQRSRTRRSVNLKTNIFHMCTEETIVHTSGQPLCQTVYASARHPPPPPHTHTHTHTLADKGAGLSLAGRSEEIPQHLFVITQWGTVQHRQWGRRRGRSLN